MPAIIVVGTQWGDEGKGKVVDWLAGDMDFVVRYQGGHNAGHTVVNGKYFLKLHLLPSGVLYHHITSVIAAGLVVDPQALIEELDALAEMGIKTPKLVISYNAHLIMPYHRILDRATEVRLGKAKIGTTGRGIGPAYADKAARIGLRVQDLLDKKIFKQKVETALKQKNAILTKVFNLPPLKLEEIVKEYESYAERIRPLIGNSTELLNQALNEGKNVLFEGAQGTMLDLDHGTYPFVTSSSPVAAGACISAGISPQKIDRIIGVAKAYTTRVGYGPFPTELADEIGEHLRKEGGEFGTTTGRPRRCGWFDAVILKYAVEVNGLTEIALTKLDVLSKLKKIKLCTAYKYKGKIYQRMPPHQTIFHKATPIYEELAGWQEDISQIRDFTKLPEEARNYVKRLEEIAGVPIKLVSVGPRRAQTIIRN
jgi:adenylosuccinate synthase